MAEIGAEVLQSAAKERTPSRKVQPPRFNNRVMTNFEDYQIKNIAVLRKNLGGTDNSVLRTAVDVFAYLSGLPVESDPSIYVNNFLANLYRNNGGQNVR